MTDYDNDLTGGGFLYGQANATYCSGEYNVNVSSDALSLILDFFQGTVGSYSVFT